MSAPTVNLRTLVALAWPIVLARATQAVVGLADGLMVAPLGEDALAATTTGAINTFAAVILPMGTVFIVQSFVAQLVGQGRGGEVHRYAWYGMVLALVAAVVALASMPLVRPLLGLLDHDPEVERLMGNYMLIRLTSVGAIVGMEALGNWYGGLGNTRMQMNAGVLTMVLDTGGNWLLIEGNLGFPALGVEGAALTSTISSWIGFGYLALAFGRGWGGVPARSGAIVLQARELGRLLRFGLPNGVNWFLEFGAFTLFLNVAVAALGKTVLGALNVIIQVNSVAFMPAFGLATAGSILAGQTIGAGAKDQVWPIVRMTLVAAAGWMAAIGLLYFTYPELVMGLFAYDDPRTGVTAAQMIAIGAPMLAVSAAWQLFDASAITFSETLRAAGDTTWCLIVRIVLAWAAFVPVSLLVVFVLDGDGIAVILCLTGYIALLAGALIWRFRSGRWKAIELTEPVLV
ncbi:MAG TPA: MATE family efflux transporter [Kofleriaceae bacterium]|nr:MATE family efflux transporter [Kofleriaceae bacterium]